MSFRRLPLVSPLTHRDWRERLQKVTKPVSRVSVRASRLSQATMRTSPAGLWTMPGMRPSGPKVRLLRSMSDPDRKAVVGQVGLQARDGQQVLVKQRGGEHGIGAVVEGVEEVALVAGPPGGNEGNGQL